MVLVIRCPTLLEDIQTICSCWLYILYVLFSINAYMVVFLFNSLKAQLNPICHLLVLLWAHHIFHVSGLRVNTEIYVFLLLCLCILIVCLCVFIVPAGTLRLPWLRFFPCFFLSCKANARVNPAKTGHGPHCSEIFVLFCVLFVLCCSVYCACVCVCVCVCVCKCVLYYCHRVASQLQLTNIPCHILYHISYHIVSYHIIITYIISYHIVSYRILYYPILSYLMLCYHIISYISYHTTSHIIYHIIPYHIISYPIVSYPIVSYVMLSYHIYHTTPHHISYIISYIIICDVSARMMGCQCLHFSCRGPKMARVSMSVATAVHFDIFRRCLNGRVFKVSDTQTGRSLKITISWWIWSPSSYLLLALLTLHTRPTICATTVSIFCGQFIVRHPPFYTLFCPVSFWLRILFTNHNQFSS